MKQAFRVELTATIIIQGTDEKKVQRIALAELILAIKKGHKIAFKPHIGNILIIGGEGKVK